MIYFEIFIDFIEVFLTTIFISYYFDFKNKYKYLLITTPILFLILEISRLTQYFGIFLNIIFVIFMILSIYLHIKKLTLEHIYICLLYSILLVINVTIWAFFKDYIPLLKIRVVDLSFNKLLQLTETILLLKFKNKLSLTLDILKWKTVVIFEFILLLLLYFLGYISLSDKPSFTVLAFCVILLLILCIMFMYIINLINTENAEKMKLIQEKQQERFDKQKYYALSKVKQEIDDIEHRLFYVVFQIEKHLENQNYDQIKSIVDYYKNDILRHQLVIDTKNHVFDVLYSAKINELIRNNVNINNYIVISKNRFYDNLAFINLINDILNIFKNCQVLEIMITENNGFVLFRIIHIDGFVDLDKAINLLEESKKELRILYKFNDFNKKGLRITFDMGMNDNG